MGENPCAGAVAAKIRDETSEMLEFEVMVRPIKALGEAMGNRIGPN